jgi:plasmid stabilization system protein ParE
MVEMLDAPAVSDAVGEIVAAARDAAAERAEQLRRELAEVEARLAELPQIG